MYYNIAFAREWNGSYIHRDTYSDWGMVPQSRPLVNPPEPKTTYIDIPGMNGAIDSTEILVSDVKYGMCEGQWKFYVLNDYNNKMDGINDWSDLYHDLCNVLHGRYATCVLESDPNHSYVGRFAISSWESSKDYSEVAINYKIYPNNSF